MRCIKVDVLQRCQKEELVELYNKYVIPLPQRKYRLNRRGREMTKKQIVAAKKRRFVMTTSTSQDDGQPKEKKRGLVTSYETPSSSSDRLKPPPSCVNFDKKTIKLGSSTSSSSTQGIVVTNNMNKLTLAHSNSQKADSVETSLCSPQKKVKLNCSLNSENDKQTDSCSDSDAVKLQSSPNKSDNTNSVNSISKIEETAATDMETEISEGEDKIKKAKIKKISWP